MRSKKREPSLSRAFFAMFWTLLTMVVLPYMIFFVVFERMGISGPFERAIGTYYETLRNIGTLIAGFMFLKNCVPYYSRTRAFGDLMITFLSLILFYQIFMTVIEVSIPGLAIAIDIHGLFYLYLLAALLRITSRAVEIIEIGGRGGGSAG
ncbi:MAG: hypothetical protein ACTSXJ_03680 [Candidatus Baldrarchaeia archaeon]